LGAARRAAKAVQCLSNERQLLIGLAAYANDENQVLMPPRDPDNFFWNRRLAEGGYVNAERTGPEFQCPDWPVDPGSSIRTYGLRCNPTSASSGGNSFTGNNANHVHRSKHDLKELREPSNFGLLFDTTVGTANLQYAIIEPNSNGYLHIRHQGAINVGFADGHAAANTMNQQRLIEERLEDRLDGDPDYHGYDEENWYRVRQ